MNITVRYRHDSQRVTTATAAPIVAAALRAGRTVTVHNNPHSTRWTLRARRDEITAQLPQDAPLFLRYRSVQRPVVITGHPRQRRPPPLLRDVLTDTWASPRLADGWL